MNGKILYNSGTHGECSWELDYKGLLRIFPTNGVSGTLASNPYTSYQKNLDHITFWPWCDPWGERSSLVKKVVVENGVFAPDNASYMFSYLKNCNQIELSGLDTSNVTNMKGMFYKCSKLTSLNLRSFNTRNVTDMYQMFDGCSGLTSLNLSGFDTTKVMNMQLMFHDCSSLKNLDLSSFNANNVGGYTNYMFWNCRSLEELNLGSGFSKSQLTYNKGVWDYVPTDLKLIAANVKSIKEIPLACGTHGDCSWEVVSGAMLKIYPTNGKSGFLANQSDFEQWVEHEEECFDEGVHHIYKWPEFKRYTPWKNYSEQCLKVVVEDGVKCNRNAKYLFDGFEKCEEMDLRGLDTTYAADMTGFFCECGNLKTVDFSNFIIKDEEFISLLLESCKRLEKVNLSSIDLSDVAETDVERLLGSGIKEIYVNSKNFKAITSICDNWYERCNQDFAKQDNIQFKKPEIKIIENPKGKEKIDSIKQKPYGRYGSCYWSINQNGTLVIKPADGKSGLLPDQSKIGSNHLPPWSYQADKVKAVYIKEGVKANKESFNLFYGLNKCERMNLSNLDTRNMEIASSMFSGCSSLKELDLSRWDVSKLKNASLMFNGCKNLESLNLNGFEAADSPRVLNMFRGCEKLKNKEVLEKQCSKSIPAWNNDKKEVAPDKSKKKNAFDTPNGR